MQDSTMSETDVPVILRPIGYRPEEDGWTVDFQLGQTRYHAVVIKDDVTGRDESTAVSRHVEFYEFRENGDLSAESGGCKLVDDER